MAMDVTLFKSALEEIEANKGVSRETIIEALKEAMAKGFKKELGGDDALVRVDFDLDAGVVAMYNIKKVVEEVEDDFLEISLEDAQEVNKDYKVGDDFLIPASLDTLRKQTAMSIKSIMKQKFAEAERVVLYEQFKDKINTLVTGRVESCDERGCMVTIGRSSIHLPRKEMIGNETYSCGDPIKVYIDDVGSNQKGNNQKGPSIHISRSSAGFLRCLMTETIPEIYNGTIQIESIAREAGERSKVAVSCSDVNIDPAGACIGQNGSKIQTIVSQLGNGSSKEKIDIITHSSVQGLFILEALKPARTVGIDMFEETKSATVIVNDDSFSLAIGKKGVNVRLAVKLTGYNIDIKTESEAKEDEIEYVSLESLQELDAENRKQAAYQAARAAVEQRIGVSTVSTTTTSAPKADVLPGLPEGYVAPQQRVYADEANDLDEALEAQVDEEELETVVKPKPVEVKEEVKETPTETVSVKTTTSLEDLEKKLEGDSSKKNQTRTYKKKKKTEEVEEETKEVKVADPSTYMSIYSDEELEELDNEEEIDDVEDEDIDYDEYDDYYDEDK